MNITQADLERIAGQPGYTVNDQMNADAESLSAAVSAGSDTGHVSQPATVPSEHDEQAALFTWASLKSHEWSELRMLYANVNGQYRPGQRPEPGLKKGVPDIFLATPQWSEHGGIIYPGLYIELKRRDRKNAKDGGLSNSQLWWIKNLRQEGYRVAICYGCAEAIEAITRYLGRAE